MNIKNARNENPGVRCRLMASPPVGKDARQFWNRQRTAISRTVLSCEGYGICHDTAGVKVLEVFTR